MHISKNSFVFIKLTISGWLESSVSIAKGSDSMLFGDTVLAEGSVGGKSGARNDELEGVWRDLSGEESAWYEVS